jgi:putative ABC transport system substrate-binding protein
MRRREFVTFLGGAAVAYPFFASAEQPGKLSAIGYLGGAQAVESSWLPAFVQRLGELGWVEGRNVSIEVRWSEGRGESVAEIADQFVRRKLDVILTYGGAVSTLKRATASIPIVFAVAVDPIGVGLVASLSHPGANVTGLSVQQTDTAGKRLELLHQIVPNLHRLGILFDAGYPATVREMELIQPMARNLGLTVSPKGIKRAEEIPSTLDALKGQAEALYVAENSLIAANYSLIAALALDMHLPTSANSAEAARAGALMSYGPNYPDLYRRAADYVDKILRGTKPGELPVEQPNKFDFVINIKTAKQLGIDIPYSIQLLADEVIE